MDLRGRTGDPIPHSAFKQLEALARRTAGDLVRQKRPFDSYPGRSPGHAGRTRRLLDVVHLPGRRTPVVTHPPAWRLHSIRLSETSTHAFTATGGVGERKNYVRKDEELWLRSNGEMFILAFRTECQSGKWSRSVTSRALTHLSAARYDYTPVWKTRQTTNSHAIVQERWLEILGKPWYQDPYETIKRLLSSVSGGEEIPSGVPLAKPGDAR